MALDLESKTLQIDDYKRYGRQMILDKFGLPGQLKLHTASVAVVGAGGLGCPALQYLAAVGIGRIGIIDDDVVELSNLQRQILHNESNIGMPKAESAAQAIRRINSRIIVSSVVQALVPSNALSLLAPYDIILDCTDNMPTRYLLSDTAVALGKPLVSGAAQKYEGQLCTYNLRNGPCYRCLFPKPPAAENTGTCEETGILGVVTGIIGNMQALEAIKIITGLHDAEPSLLCFSALGTPLFRSFKLRSRKPMCAACGESSQKAVHIESTDYIQFCGGRTPDWEKQGLLDDSPSRRIHATDFRNILSSDEEIQILDVRPITEFGICQLSGSVNVPLHDLVANPSQYIPKNAVKAIYVVCRLGNDSQIGADALREVLPQTIIKDVIGGLKAWARDVDSNFPVY